MTISNQKSSKKIIEISDNYRPQASEKYMCDKHLEYFRRKLIDWKMALLSHEVNFAEEIGNSHIRGDEGDMAHSEVDMILEIKKSSRGRKLIERIEAALERIEKREYGYCEHTGAEIGLKRLEVRPVATLCISAQEKHEKFEKNHNHATQNFYNIDFSSSHGKVLS